MSLRVATANLLKKFRFSASQALRASRVTTNALPISFSGKLNLSHWYPTGAYNWRVNLRDPCLWFVISGYVAVSLGISANTVFAEGVTTEASFSNNPGDNPIGLSKIEDGSVGKLDDAEKLFLSAIQEAKEGFGKQDPHVASACNNLAELYRVKKAFDKAEPLYLEAINILEESFGPDDIRVGVAAHNLGQFYLGQRKLEKAHLSYEIKRRVLGYGHSECSDTMYLLGVSNAVLGDRTSTFWEGDLGVETKVLYLQGKERDSEILIKDCIRMLEEGGEGESFVCIRRLRYLSQIYLKSHRLADAEMVQRKILHIMELSKGWNSLDTVIAAESLALTLQASCNTKDSKELLERCLDARKALLPDDHIQIGANLLHLARVAMLDFSQHKKGDASRAKAELDMAKHYLHNSIRIARQCLDKVLKQKNKPRKYSVPGDSRKEGQAALLILLQSLSTLSSVELAKQELQETQEGNINLVAREVLLQCISAYKERLQ
ncbi:Tetratricopeptide-like helical domain superfamily [Sesbania bispinosa]|nr:Tetratricopeptide-like helical domain superfamily [Sesbania bispinosa]